MREFLYIAAVVAITAALIPWPHLFPLWVVVILIVFFSTLPPARRGEDAQANRERGS